MSFIWKWLVNLFVSDSKTNDVQYWFDDNKFSKITMSKYAGKITHGKGVVSFISPYYGLINNKLYFDAMIAPKYRKLTVGDIVHYRSFKASEKETERIICIDELDDSFSGSETDNSLEISERTASKRVNSLHKSLERVLSGKISVKQGDDLFIQPLNLRCNLKNVQCLFIPIEGDWVSVVTDVSVSADSFNYVGGIHHIKSLNPLLIKNGTGVITYLNSQKEIINGVIENEIFFSTDFCKLDFSLNFGDQVVYEAVESDQGKYKWRAVTVRSKTQPEDGSPETRVLKRNNKIQISGEFNFGPLEVGESQENTLTVKNNGNDNQVVEGISFSTSMKRSQLRQKLPEKDRQILIEPGNSIDFVFECKANFLGLSNEFVTFHFKNFKISKEFNVDVVLGRSVNDLLARKESDNLTQKIILKEHFDLSDAMIGKQPTSMTRFNSRTKATSYHYPIPEKLFEIVLGDYGDVMRRNMTSVKERIFKYAPCLKDALNWTNYAERFHMLLYLEEIQCKITFRKYDLHGVILRKSGKYLEINVSDMENRDIFTIGTSVVVTQPWSEMNNRKQVGYVYENRDGVLRVRFHESFHEIYDESDCDVIFQPMRTSFVRCHAAVDLAVQRLTRNWLFPVTLKEKPSIINVSSSEQKDSEEPEYLKLSSLMCDVDENGYVVPPRAQSEYSVYQSEHKLNWFNPNLNKLQRDAVVHILEGKCRPLPYVIFGPPGTGKTMTVVEVVLQIYTLISHSRLLIGTPSNSAADVICHHLISMGKFTPGELVRLLSQSRAASRNVPENIIPYCWPITDDHLVKSNVRMSDTFQSVCSQRVIVSTCCSFGLLHMNGFQQGHFSHIIIDEAAQASEPEALIPITFLDPKRGQVVLCGDTNQLGPVSMGFYGQNDLSSSILERVCKSPPYKSNLSLFPCSRGFDTRCITRLRDNYRTVPELLNIPSQLFYNSELRATLSQESGTEAEIIRRFNFQSEKRKTPPSIIFHGIRGRSYQENDSHSWYNPLEIWQSISYLKRLYSIGLSPEDVGIITPYRKQVQKLRQLLSKLHVPVPKIGSVEEFQGEERYAIILSTVRSSAKVDEVNDKILGFLASPRRVNVAITRARAILIIVGNPFILRLDPYWSVIIQYCIKNNSCTGCSFEEWVTEQNTDK